MLPFAKISITYITSKHKYYFVAFTKYIRRVTDVEIEIVSTTQPLFIYLLRVKNKIRKSLFRIYSP